MFISGSSAAPRATKQSNKTTYAADAMILSNLFGLLNLRTSFRTALSLTTCASTRGDEVITQWDLLFTTSLIAFRRFLKISLSRLCYKSSRSARDLGLISRLPFSTRIRIPYPHRTVYNSTDCAISLFYFLFIVLRVPKLSAIPFLTEAFLKMPAVK